MGQAGIFWSVAHQLAIRPSDAVAIAGKPFMDEPVGGNSSARVPVDLAVVVVNSYPIKQTIMFRADGLFPSLYILHTLCSS